MIPAILTDSRKLTNHSAPFALQHIAVILRLHNSSALFALHGLAAVPAENFRGLARSVENPDDIMTLCKLLVSPARKRVSQWDIAINAGQVFFSRLVNVSEDDIFAFGLESLAGLGANESFQ